MDYPTELLLEDVRCFQGPQVGCLRPITLLVGENSTGKTTFLGCYRVLHRLLAARDVDDELDFNREPFLMGSFRDIVRARRGRNGGIDEFKIGFLPRRGPVPKQVLTFSERGSQPVVSSMCFEFGEGSYLRLRRGTGDKTVVEIPNKRVEIDYPLGRARSLLDFRPAPGRAGLSPIMDYLNEAADEHEGDGRATRWTLLQRTSWRRHRVRRFPEPIAVAPLRSKPKRTYDPVRETASPDGEHFPMLMMRLDHTDKQHWSSLYDELVDFGSRSGLFSDIKVKRHGRQMSDPFELQVKVRSGAHSNIMDVGYGVSQSLPILVDVMDAKSRVFLLQQPEVHLHPRGQAELASLFIESSTRRRNRFLIETHSDYIIDRVRISVRQGLLKATDVSILYFEPQGSMVNIHNMTLDRDGNLLDAPVGYRDFFLQETDRLLGFAD